TPLGAGGSESNCGWVSEENADARLGGWDVAKSKPFGLSIVQASVFPFPRTRRNARQWPLATVNNSPRVAKRAKNGWFSFSLVAEFSHNRACAGVAGIRRVARSGLYHHDALDIA